MRRSLAVVAVVMAGVALADVLLKHGGVAIGPVTSLNCGDGAVCTRAGSTGTITASGTGGSVVVLAVADGGSGTGSLTCTGTQKLTSNGSVFSCGTDVDTVPYTGAACVSSGVVSALNGASAPTCVTTIPYALDAGIATQLRANPTDCAGLEAASAIDAWGNLTCIGTVASAQTASSLILNPGDCAAQQFAVGITADGTATCGSLTCAGGGVTTSSSGTLSCVTNVPTATALAADPADCTPSTTGVAVGVAAAGTATCTTTASALTAGAATALAADPADCAGATTGVALGVNASGTAVCTTSAGALNAGTSTALAADPADCTPSTTGVAVGVVASGAAVCTTSASALNAGTATALAADPTDCTAQQFAVGIAASGAATCGSLSCSAGQHVYATSGTLSCTADTGAPATADYWTGTAQAGLSAEIAMGALATGLVINTTTTGIPTILAAQTCTAQFVRSYTASGTATCSGVGVADFTPNQGTTAQFLRGSGAGPGDRPTWSAPTAADVTPVQDITWAAVWFGLLVDTTDLVGQFKSFTAAGARTYGKAYIACHWQTAGSGGTTVSVATLFNRTDGVSIGTCNLQACNAAPTTAATECAVSGTITASKMYTLRLTKGDCTTAPTNVVCNTRFE